jgi:hypothetical protein
MGGEITAMPARRDLIAISRQFRGCRGGKPILPIASAFAPNAR